MPKVSLESARARDKDILEKLGRVQKAAQSHKQHSKLSQQRHEWTEQARGLAWEARRLEAEVSGSAAELGIWQEVAEDAQAEDATNEMWLQVAGLRQLLAQLRLRDMERLKQAPQQALQLQAALSSVGAAVRGQAPHLAAEASVLEGESATLRSKLRAQLAAEHLWPASSTDRADRADREDRCDLSDEEDDLLQNLGDEEDYRHGLEALNSQVATAVADMEQELADLRRKRAGWNDDAHFRFLHVKREFQGRGRELFVERLRLEFPHLSRDQLQQHEATCDGMKFAGQRQAAAFRQWRRDRLDLLRRHQLRLQQRLKEAELQQQRQQEKQEIRDKGKVLQGRLQVERAKASAKREERQREQSQERSRQQVLKAEREEKQRQRAEAVRQMSRDFAEKRREQQQREQELQAEQEQKEAEERAARMARNATMVEMRRQMDELKRKEVAQKRMALEQEQLERHMALQRAIDHLRVEAPRDPARLHKVPERLNAEAYNDPLVCVTRGPAAGFDEKQLMADARYKLSAALQAAGLFTTKAGQEALSRVAAPKPAQPTLVSQVFSGGYPG